MPEVRDYYQHQVARFSNMSPGFRERCVVYTEEEEDEEFVDQQYSNGDEQADLQEREEEQFQ